MTWHFREQSPGDPTRDPIVGEFFSTDAIANPAEALIREGIQNSLDAGLPGRPVRIRIGLGTGNKCLPASQVKRWLGSAWPHIAAPGNGLREAPSLTSHCPYLVFEDFGTSGLSGDPAQPFDEPGSRNLFFYFFRAEGRSSKGETDRGRWGVGKHVFPRASVISTTFGYTVRADDSRKLLMGHSILKSHKLDGSYFTPDAYFGQIQKDSLVLPFEIPSVLELFRSDFGLSRIDEPGLSIVVPFLDGEFTRDNLAAAVISGYFHPILERKLSVRIDAEEGSLDITADSLLESITQLDSQLQSDLLPLVELAGWYSTTGINLVRSLSPCDPDRPFWTPELVPESLVPELRQKLGSGERVAIRCHLTVREKGRPTRPSHFDVCLCQDDCESGRAVFIREGIIISNVKAPRTRGIRALVIVEDKALATLLGDSENPAHTEWQKDSSHFKGKYVYGKSYIDFVAKAPYELVQRLRSDEETPDTTLLLDVFSLPDSPDEASPKRPDSKAKEKPGEVPGEEIDSIEPRKKRFRIQKTSGGFVVHGTDAMESLPAALRIRVAYDVRKGNPLRKYSPADFKLDSAPIKLEQPINGVEMVSISNNALNARITSSDFRIAFAGFDSRRDLFVNVSVEESSDAS